MWSVNLRVAVIRHYLPLHICIIRIIQIMICIQRIPPRSPSVRSFLLTVRLRVLVRLLRRVVRVVDLDEVVDHLRELAQVVS